MLFFLLHINEILNNSFLLSGYMCVCVFVCEFSKVEESSRSLSCHSIYMAGGLCSKGEKMSGFHLVYGDVTCIQLSRLLRVLLSTFQVLKD